MGPMPMTVAVYDDWLVLAVRDNCDLAPADSLAEVVTATGMPQVTGVRVDLRVAVATPATIRAVLAAEEAARRRDWRFRLNGCDTLLPLDAAAAAHDWGGGWTGIAPVRLGQPDAAGLRAGLTPPYRAFFQTAGGDMAMVGARCVEAVRRGGLAVSVATDAACALDIAQHFDHAVFSRGWRDDSEQGNLMVLCLAEAIGNAIIHGNLGMDGGLRTGRQGFERFSTLMAERLGDPARAGRRIEVSLHPHGETIRIAVRDQGDGFDDHARPDGGPSSDTMQGRGLSLMRKSARQVWYEDGGRVVVLEFAVPNQEQETAG